MWGSIDLFFVREVEIDLVLYVGRKSIGFSVSVELYFVSVWVVAVNLILLWGSNLT